MECEDTAAYYTFTNGEIYLSTMFDRYTTKKQGKFSPGTTTLLFDIIDFGKYEAEDVIKNYR